MLDSDLARLYSVPTKALNQAVRRNKSRFPADFMFPLTKEEAANLISQFAISRLGRGGRRKAVLAFTQEGVSMLSCVLRSPRAIAANVAIMRAFIRYREAALANAELSSKLKELEGRVDTHDGAIRTILEAMKRMIERPKEAVAPKIGFKP